MFRRRPLHAGRRMPMPADLIGPVLPTSRVGEVVAHTPRALPNDILRQASRRLGVFSLIVAVLWILGTVLGHIAGRMITPRNPHWLRIDSTDVIAIASVVVSVALFAYTRRSTRRPQFVLDLGLGYMVLMALALGLMFHWGPVPEGW